MSIEKFIADRITGRKANKGNISGPIVKIGITGIGLGMAVMLLTVSIVPGFKKEIVARITGLTSHIVISNINANPGSEPDPLLISADTLAKLRSLPGVRNIQPCAFKNGLLKTAEENEGVMLKGIDPSYDFTFLRDKIIAGRLPVLNDTLPSPDILVSKSLSVRLGLKCGDRIESHFITTYPVFDSLAGGTIQRSTHRSRKFTVCGIFETGFSDFDERLGIVDIRHVRKLNGWSEQSAGSFEVVMDDYTAMHKCAEEMREVLGYNYSVSTVDDIYSSIFLWLDKLDVNGVIVVILMIIVAVMNMVTALLILILERSNMIGLVKSLGMSNVDVRRLFFMISLRLTGRGLLWGNLVGIALCLLQYFFRIAKLESETYYVDYVAIDLNWMSYLMLNLGTIFVCCLVLYLPTFLVTRLTPMRTLKFD